MQNDKIDMFIEGTSIRFLIGWLVVLITSHRQRGHLKTALNCSRCINQNVKSTV